MMSSLLNQTTFLVQVACFLHREIPVRLAHRVVELEVWYYIKCFYGLKSILDEPLNFAIGISTFYQKSQYEKRLQLVRLSFTCVAITPCVSVSM